MDSISKQSCLDEISHSICDLDKKMTVLNVSNKWNLPVGDSESLLLEWLDKNKDVACIKKYIIRGNKENNIGVVSIIPAEKLKIAEQNLSKFISTLYSIELPAKSSNQISDASIVDIKRINLPIESENRPLHQATTILVAEATKHSKSHSSVDANTIKLPDESGKKISKTAETSETKIVDVNIKSSKTKPATTNTTKKIESKNETIKKEISSFFRPSQKSKSIEIEQPLTKIEPTISPYHKVPKLEAAKSDIEQDFDSVDNVILATPEPDKKSSTKSTKKVSTIGKTKLIKNKNNNSKHSRIIKTDESTDEEEVADEIDVSKIENQEKSTENENMKKEPENDKKRKIKRTVTKTYEDEDGYIKTVKTVEDVSCSDEDIVSTNQEPTSKNMDKTISPIQVSPTKAKKKKIQPKVLPTKQGSILSFFSKK